MHGCELVELAAILASSGRILVSADRSIRSQGLEEYWVASKCRLDRWGLALASYNNELQSHYDGTERFQPTRCVIEEIFATEVLTRVWTAICCGDLAETAANYEAASICRNVFAGHLEASARAMRVLAETDRIGIEEAVSLNRLRRRNERWNDLLLSLCREFCDVRSFAHCQKRVSELAPPGDRYERSVLLAAVQIGCRHRVQPTAANPESNRRIAAAVLACIGSDSFDSGGLMHTDFISRLYGAPDDSQELVSQIVPAQSPSAEFWAEGTHSPRSPSQRNRF